MRKFCTFLIIILLANISFLFSPRNFPEKAIHKWGDFYISLNNSMGIRVNGDAFAFVSLAIEPGHLFDENQVRQSRPGYILAAHLAGTAIYGATYPFRDQLESFFQKRISDKYPQKEKEKIARWFSYYSAYILLNFTVLMLAFYLFDALVRQISGPWKSMAIRNLLLFLLIDNPIMKLFFWSPHVQVFTIITPLLMVYACYFVMRNADKSVLIYFSSFLAGLLLLCYGSFLLLLPAFLFGYWYQLRLNNNFRIGHDFLKMGLVVCCFFLPLLSWIVIVQLNTTRFYSAEIGEYRQFVWIADTVKESPGTFFQALGLNTLAFIKSMPSLLISFLLLSLAYLTAKRASTGRVLEAPAKHILGFCLGALVIFLWLMGYYADRLTLGIGSLLLLLAAILLNEEKKSGPVITACYLITIAWHMLLVLGNPTAIGPYYFN